MRVLLAAAVMSISIGCGSDDRLAISPTTASVVPPAPAPPPAPNSFQPTRLAGRVVDDANVPVPGATLTPWNSGDTQMSDISGLFDATFRVNPQGASFWITVEKAGFETSELMRSLATASTTVLRLHQIRVATPGDSVTLTIAPDDSACGYHWGYLCRRIRVRPSSSGTLAVDVTSPNGEILGVPIGDVGFPQSFKRQMSLAVSAGSEVSIDIAAGSSLGGPAEFTLRTSLSN